MPIGPEQLLTLISSKNYLPQTKEELAARFKSEGVEKKTLDQWIAELDGEGRIIITKRGKIMLPINGGFLSGTYSASEKGYGFLVPDEKTSFGDLFIPAKATLGAMHGDRIMAKITGGSQGLLRAEGEITRIIRRKTSSFIGRFEKGKSHGFVIPDARRLTDDVFIAGKDAMNAKSGD